MSRARLIAHRGQTPEAAWPGVSVAPAVLGVGVESRRFGGHVHGSRRLEARGRGATGAGAAGEGGMAAVYRVRHVHLDTLHALKILTMTAKSVRRRLMQEGRQGAASLPGDTALKVGAETIYFSK